MRAKENNSNMNKYWGRKNNNTKPPSSSSSSSPLITSIISTWFSKSKLKLLNNSPKSTVITPPPISSGWGEGRFYSMDEDDAYWRLSFGDESWIDVQGRRSTGGLINVNPSLWYDNHHRVIPADHEIMHPTNEKYQNFNEMVSDIRKMRERHPNHHQRDVYPVEYSDCVFDQPPHVIPISEHKKLKEIKVKMEYQNKSAGRNRVKATYSPRTECKIRALEDMKKKARKKKKKKMKEIASGGKSSKISNMFDSFAVVKSSFNPQKDFRDSMVEMIREKGIAGRPEELEQLLACYLTLNSHEYHDLIIKVFRQLWSDIHS